MRILLVDDTEFFRHSCARLMQTLGHDVVEAANGSEAIQIWEEQKGRIDAVVTDVQMPVFDGINLLGYFSGLEQPPRCYVHSGDEFYDFEKGRLELKEIGTVFGFAEFHHKVHFTNAIREFLAKLVAA